MFHPMAGVEIERKFLVAELPPELADHPGERIEQGYLAIAPDGVEVRVRRRAGQATLTVKSGPGQVRTEEELAIDARRFDALWQLTDGPPRQQDAPRDPARGRGGRRARRLRRRPRRAADGGDRVRLASRRASASLRRRGSAAS